jgi:hypothetical protein
MTRFAQKLPLLALLLSAAALPALAASSASSAASDSVSTSVGSISTSFQKSSNSSSKGTDVAEGEYRVVEVAAVAERPGTVRLTLQALADPTAQGEVLLLVPVQAAEQGHIAAGQVVTARQRAFGVEFASAQTPFFLVLHDEVYRELHTQAVSL